MPVRLLFCFLMLFSFPVRAGAAEFVSYADVVESVLPSVVSVSATKAAAAPPEMMLALRGSPFEEFFKEFYMDGRFDAPKSILLGSGFIYDAQGHVITSAHVVENMSEVMVTLNDGTALKGKVIGKDAKTDIALLKIDAPYPLTPVRPGPSDAARTGDSVLAVGNPFGLGNTVTSGIISARSRDIQVGPYDDFIQTDAAINRGNSGGPLFNAKGEMIGVNTAIFSPSGGSVGIAFAVPSKMAGAIADALIKDGTVKRGRLGLKIQTVTPEIAKSLGLPKVYGALVSGIDKDAPAANSKIKTGDIVIRYNGAEVVSMRALPRMAAESKAGSTVPVTVWRDGREVNLSLTVDEMKEPPAPVSAVAVKTDDAEVKEVPVLGLTLAELTPSVRQKYRLPKNASGLIVTAVAPKSDASVKGLRTGDLLVELDKKTLSGPAAVDEWEKEAAESGQDSAFLLIDRAGDRFFAVVKFVAAQ